jgi:hypothetical protein
VPRGVLDFVVTVRVAGAVVEDEHVAPDGQPAIVKPTKPLKMPDGVTVAVYVVLPPCATVLDDGVALTVKSAGA